MKRLLTLGAVAICVFGIACGGGDDKKDDTAQDTQTATQGTEDEDDHAGHDHADHDHPAPGNDKAEMLKTGAEISLSGNMGCGHCNFQIGSSCTAAMKTADGHIIILDDVPEESEMFKSRMEGAEVTVAGVVSYDEAGVAHMKLKDTPM